MVLYCHGNDVNSMCLATLYCSENTLAISRSKANKFDTKEEYVYGIGQRVVLMSITVITIDVVQISSSL